MGRPSYVCTFCSEHFTRKYSAKRHNQNLHNVQYSTSPVYPSRQKMDYQRYRGGLSKDTLLKIDQLKRLLNKYPQFFTNPNQIYTWTIHWAINGDNKILDENLEQLRYIDNLANAQMYIR